jgi:regulator of protease activity HflC (stomatin/prohibitin superfamily)
VFGQVLIGMAIAVIVYLVARVGKFRPRRVTVYEFQRGLLYRSGRFEKVLGPGRYWTVEATHAITLVDIRPTFVSLVGQEVLTADGVPVKISIAASYEVADAALAVNRQSNYTQALYLVLQLRFGKLFPGSMPMT